MLRVRATALVFYPTVELTISLVKHLVFGSIPPDLRADVTDILQQTKSSASQKRAQMLAKGLLRSVADELEVLNDNGEPAHSRAPSYDLLNLFQIPISTPSHRESRRRLLASLSVSPHSSKKSGRLYSSSAYSTSPRQLSSIRFFRARTTTSRTASASTSYAARSAPTSSHPVDGTTP
jgi:hypothetical protein